MRSFLEENERGARMNGENGLAARLLFLRAPRFFNGVAKKDFCLNQRCLSEMRKVSHFRGISHTTTLNFPLPARNLIRALCLSVFFVFLPHFNQNNLKEI